MISFIAFSMCLVREGMWNMYIARETPNPLLSPLSSPPRWTSKCLLAIYRADSVDYFPLVPNNFILKEIFHSGKI